MTLQELQKFLMNPIQAAVQNPNQAIGSAGKILTNVGTALNAPQIIPGGLGAAAQNYASPQNRSNNLPFAPVVNAQGGGVSTENNPPVVDKTVNPSTGGGVSGTGGNIVSQSTNLGEQLAGSETDRRIRMIRELFDQGSQQVNAYRNNINSRFDDIAKAVGAFKDRAGVLRDNSGQEITNESAGILGSNAKTAQELAGTANAQGRNLGLSSKVNMGQKLLGNLQATQGNTLAKRGENYRTNDANYQERIDTGDAQMRDAESAKSAGLEQANLYDRQNLSNFGDNFEGAQLNFATLLNNVLGKSEALSAMKAPDASGLTAYDPSFNGIVNTINGTLSSVTNGGNGQTSDAGNLANPQTYADLLKKYKGIYTG